MKMQAVFLCLAGLICLSHLHAQDASQWRLIGKTDQESFYIKYGSVNFIKNNAVGPAVTGIVEHSGTAESNMVTYQQVTVSLRDCSRGMGKLLVYDMDGYFVAATDYVKGGGSFASGVADTLCEIAATTSNQKQPTPNG